MNMGHRAPATVTVTVTGTNDGPVAVADTGDASENGIATFDVLTNDTDADDGATFTLEAAGVSSGAGTASVVDGLVSYDPGTAYDHLALGETATVEIAYTMADDARASSTSTLTLTLTGTNDGPTAIADTGATDQETATLIDVLANDTDVDNGASFTLLTASVSDGFGSAVVSDGQVSYDPAGAYDHLALGETAEVTIAYSMSDEHGAESASLVTVTVTGTNDGPTAVADTGDAAENGVASFDVLANDTDIDNGAVFSLKTANVSDGLGAASVVDGQVSFDPGTDYDYLAVGETATVVIDYTMADEHGAESAATLTLTITGSNDGPTAVADTGRHRRGYGDRHRCAGQ